MSWKRKEFIKHFSIWKRRHNKYVCRLATPCDLPEPTFLTQNFHLCQQLCSRHVSVMSLRENFSFSSNLSRFEILLLHSTMRNVSLIEFHFPWKAHLILTTYHKCGSNLEFHCRVWWLMNFKFSFYFYCAEII